MKMVEVNGRHVPEDHEAAVRQKAQEPKRKTKSRATTPGPKESATV